MSKFGIFTVLVEILGIWLYYKQKIYLGIVWCLFWITGIIYYETVYQKRARKLHNQFKPFMAISKAYICRTDEKRKKL